MSRLVTFTRVVRPLSAVTSKPRAISLILPSSSASMANGADANPTSIWPVMVWVKVAGGHRFDVEIVLADEFQEAGMTRRSGDRVAHGRAVHVRSRLDRRIGRHIPEQI